MKKTMTITLIILMLASFVFSPISVYADTPPERPAPASHSLEDESNDASVDQTAALEALSSSTLEAIVDENGGSQVFQAGADRLASLQNDDGGWDWPLDNGDPTTSSPANTIGPIGMGLAQAYLHTSDTAHQTALVYAGSFLQAKIVFSPSDGYLAAMLDNVFVGTTYVDFINANFYDKLAAGTYERNEVSYYTHEYVDMIRTARANQGIPNLAAWDIGLGLVGASSVGADTGPWIDGVKAEIDELDGGAVYDVIGLAGAVYGLAFVGEDHNPSAGEHAAAASLGDLAAILAGYQIDGGGFTWNKNYPNPGEYNETIQETAYALLALKEVDRTAYSSAIQGGAEYMKSVQLLTGGWNNWAGGGENNEVTGEALWGISAALPGPLTIDVFADPNPVALDSSIQLSATVDNSTTGCSIITSAEFSLDGEVWSSMDASDGEFDEIIEDVITSVVAPSEAEIYDVCVRGTDVVGNTGEPACTMLVVYDPDGGFVTGGGWIDSPEDAYRSPTTEYYGDLTLDTPCWNTSYPEEWDLTSCDININYSLDMSQMGDGWVPIEVGIKEPSAGNIDPNGRGGWMLAQPQSAGNTDPTSLDDDDHFLLVDHGWLSDELNYDVNTESNIVSNFGTYDNVAFWFDRDGVDEFQAIQWDMSQNGTAYNTAGIYEVSIDYRFSASDSRGIMFATINGGKQGFYTSGWMNAQPEIFPAGKSFSLLSGDFSQLNLFVGSGAIVGQTMIKDLTVTGCLPTTGKATFGFVSKYKKGADVPTGNTEFVFNAADLNFHSSSYQWLIVTGSNYAKFKGAGTINGMNAPNDEPYKFMIWAGDGTGDDGADTFRIKIWYEDGETETVVYDNGMDQEIGAGSIIVHTKK